jgi:hypothetical protein
MNPFILASFLPVLALSSGDVSPISLSEEVKLEANRIGIEQCGTETQQATLIEVEQRGTEANQNVAFTYTMDKSADELHNQVAANLPPESSRSIYAVQPQADRTESEVTLAVYPDQDQSKEAPMLALNAIQLENGTRIEDKQDKSWTTAFSAPERTEQTGRTLA